MNTIYNRISLFGLYSVSDGNGNPIAKQRGARDCNEQHDRVEVPFKF